VTSRRATQGALTGAAGGCPLRISVRRRATGRPAAGRGRSLLRGAVAFLLAAVLGGVGGLAAATEATSVPESTEQIRLSFAPVVKKVAPAVVNIYASKIVTRRGGSPLFDDPFFRRFFGEDFPWGGQPRRRIENSLGSGVIVDGKGLIVTNNHVIEGADEITVALADRREFDAEIVLADERTDLAVLRVDVKGGTLPAIRFGDSDALEVGDIVLAIGNPFGVGQTVTSGIVSALARTRVGVSDFQFFIQTDAAINPGNSGGALVALDGTLVGVNTAIYSRSGGSVGIGFAIPVNMVATVLENARNGGKVRRPWLGAAGQPVTAEVAASLGLDRPGGVLVNAVYPGSPADEAGLKIGDVILAVEGHEVIDPSGLDFRIATAGRLGERVRLSIIRNGRPLEIAVELLAAPEKPPRDITRLTGRHYLNGAVVGSLSPAFAEELGLDPFATGVVILEIRRGSPAHRLGLRPGDIVVRVGGAEIKTVAKLRRELRRQRGVFKLGIRRGDQLFNLMVEG